MPILELFKLYWRQILIVTVFFLLTGQSAQALTLQEIINYQTGQGQVLGDITVDYTLNTSGPHHVVQGKNLFFLVIAQVIAGTDESATPSVSGLPAGASTTFPEMTKFCCGTFLWRIGGDTPGDAKGFSVKITTSANTPTGTYPLTITFTSSSGVVRTTVFNLIVDPVPPPITKLPFPADIPLSSQAKWELDMTIYGKKHCVPEEMATWEGFVWYYDGGRVYYQIADYTKDPSWNTCAQMVIDMYRKFILDNNGGIQGYRYFPVGLAMNFERTGDPLSKQAIGLMRDNSGYSNLGNISYYVDWSASREMAYALDTHIAAERVGDARNANFQDIAEIIFGHFGQWFVDKNAGYTQPFMVALSSEALIDYWNLTKDPRVPPMLKLAADEMWQQSWNSTTRSFNYYNGDGTFGTNAQDLNLLIAPLYGWVYQQTGDVKYRAEGDEIFDGGVASAWLDGGKQYSQNYRWSMKYVEWRKAPTDGGPPPATKYPRLITLTSLEGISAIPANQPVTATVLSGSTILETQNLVPNASKQYAITFLSTDPQLVNIRIKATRYLSQSLTNIDTTVNFASALTVAQFLAGDLNNDNTINALDYSVLNSHWNQNYPTADINQDGLINSIDFAILKNNWNRQGQ